MRLARTAAFIGFFALPALAVELTPEEIAGRALYRHGTGAGGAAVVAYLAGQTEVKGNIVPCANCHGLDGRGRPEGGVVPPSVRWEDLARSTPKRPAHTNRSVLRAVAMGMSATGAPLHAVMPRYALTQTDAANLAAYLKKLSTDQDPGLSDTAIRIGAILPAEARFPGLGQSVRAALAAYFDSINRQGGIYGRRVEFLARESPGELLETESVFALVSSFLAGAEEQTIPAIERQGTPLIGGWTLLPRPSPLVFYLDGGLPAQVHALAMHALEKLRPSSGFAIVVSQDPLSQAALPAVRAAWGRVEELVLTANSAPAVLARLREKKLHVAMALAGPAQLRELAAEAKRPGAPLTLLIPGAFASATLIRELALPAGRAVTATQFLPGDVTPEALAERRSFPLPSGGEAAQLTALCEARLLVEGLKRAGRDLTRERLVESMESIYDFPAGYRQLVSFGRNRHIGIPEVRIVVTPP